MLTPLKITLLYAAVGCCWILFSDQALLFLTVEPEMLNRLQHLKGILFVGFTAWVLFFLIRRHDAMLRQRERRLKEHLVFLDTLINTLPNPVFVKDREGVYQGCNTAFSKMILGVDRERIVGRTLFDLPEMIPPDLAKVYHRKDLALMEHPGTQTYEAEVRCSDGERRHFFFSKATWEDETGVVAGIVGVMLDISDRKRVELEIARSRVMLENLINAIPDLVFYKDTEGIYRACNDALLRFLGKERREILGLRDDALFPSEMAAFFRRNDRKALALEAPHRNEERVVNADGSEILLDTVKTALRDPDGEILGLLGISRDITERKRAEEALRLDEARLEALLKLNQMHGATPEEIKRFALEEAVALTKSRVGYLCFLEEGEAVLSRQCVATKDQSPETGYRSCTYSIPVSEAGRWADAVRLRKPVVVDAAERSSRTDFPECGESVSRHLNVPVFEAGRMVAVVGVGNKDKPYEEDDVRQLTLLMQGMWRLVRHIEAEGSRRKLEDQLEQARKMESLGTLASGIAHDFNNLLQAMMGYAELAKQGASGENLSFLRQVLQAGKRAKRLVRQILVFGRQGERTLVAVRPSRLVEEVSELLRASLPATIEIREKLESHAETMADPDQLHQILMNLGANAAYAMEETGGVLTIRLRAVRVDPRRVEDPEAGLIDLAPGDYLRLEVEDTGDGIPEEVRDRVFDPFFTTKPKGRGTGMGLSVVHGIVKSHGGEIRVDTKAGKGTRFSVFLPLISPAETASISAEIEPAGRAERILLVDDEEALAVLGREILEHFGYEVTALTRPEEALARFQANPDGFDLVFTDLTMPGITGDDLIREIRSIRTDIPAVLCSGYADALLPENFQTLGNLRMVGKPFVMTEMAGAVREALDAAAP